MRGKKPAKMLRVHAPFHVMLENSASTILPSLSVSTIVYGTVSPESLTLLMDCNANATNSSVSKLVRETERFLLVNVSLSGFRNKPR